MKETQSTYIAHIYVSEVIFKLGLRQEMGEVIFPPLFGLSLGNFLHSLRRKKQLLLIPAKNTGS